MWHIFIVTFLDWWGNPSDQVWSSLIHFGQIWPKKIKNKRAIFILSVNVTNFYRNIVRLVRKSNLIKFDHVWSILDGSDPKKSKIKWPFLFFLKMWQLFIVTFFDWWEIQFDQFWSSFIHFGRIWSKKIKNKMAIFILFENVTTFYTDIFWYVQPLRSFFSDRRTEGRTETAQTS